MKQLNLNNLTDDELVERFIKAAKEQGYAVLDSEVRRANRMFHFIRAIDSLLRERGTKSRENLLPLLEHKDRFVRYYAAQALLGLVPERARAVIEWNAKYGFDAIAGDANGLLRAFDTGEYKPD
jgi:hypothetical protein